MAFNPSLASDKDKVRLAVGDVDESDEFFADSTYNSVIQRANNLRDAALQMAQNIWVKLARETDYSASKVSESKSQAFAAYEKVRKAIRAMDEDLNSLSGMVPGTIRVGGALKSEEDALDADDNLTRPSFSRGQFDTPDVWGYEGETPDDEDGF